MLLLYDDSSIYIYFQKADYHLGLHRINLLSTPIGLVYGFGLLNNNSNPSSNPNCTNEFIIRPKCLLDLYY
jgi:hypothetical protein